MARGATAFWKLGSLDAVARFGSWDVLGCDGLRWPDALSNVKEVAQAAATMVPQLAGRKDRMRPLPVLEDGRLSSSPGQGPLRRPSGGPAAAFPDF